MANSVFSKNLFGSVAPLALGAILFAGNAGAQPAGQPSTARGDWPMYFADPSGSRY